MRRIERMNWKLTGVVFALLAAAFFVSYKAPFVAADPTPNETASSVTISGIVDVTVNCTAIGFGSLSAGVANSSSTNCFPLIVTLWANTNTQTAIAVNGSNLMNNSVVYGVRNVTYANVTAAPKTELNATFTSGDDNVTHGPYDDWVNIGDPAIDTNKTIFWYLTTPSTILKGVYAGTIYVRVTDTG